MMLRLIRSLSGHTEVVSLFLRELGQFHPDVIQVQAGDLFVELLGQAIDADVVRGAIGPELQSPEVFERLNPALPPEAITTAVDELTRDRSAMSLEAANREVYLLLKGGIKGSVAERDSISGRAELPLRPNVPGGAATPPYRKGGQTTVRLHLIDWEQPANNHFLLVSQFSVTGALSTCRPDLAGFINGLLLVVIELKQPGGSAPASAFIKLQHNESALRSACRGKVENCDSL